MVFALEKLEKEVKRINGLLCKGTKNHLVIDSLNNKYSVNLTGKKLKRKRNGLYYPDNSLGAAFLPITGDYHSIGYTLWILKRAEKNGDIQKTINYCEARHAFIG